MKNLLKAVTFLLVFALGLSALYRIFSWKDTAGNYLSCMDAFYEINDEDRVDVLFIGPSYTYNFANPAILWNSQGIAAFTMGISGQDKHSAYACMLEALQTQTPEVVCIDYSVTMFDQYGVKSNVYRNLLTHKLSLTNLKLIEAVGEDFGEKMDYVLRWPIVHTRYRELQRYDFVQYEPSLYTLGHNYTFDTVQYEGENSFYHTEESIPCGEADREFIDKVMELAREKQCRVLFYLTPGFYSEESTKRVNGVEAYMDEIGADYVDLRHYAEEMVLDRASDFCDNTHLNEMGSMKSMKFMSRYLTQRYELADHRGDQRYEAWEMCSRYQQHVSLNRSLGNIKNADSVAEVLSSMDSMGVVFSLSGDYQESERIAAAFDFMGLYEYSFEEGGTWILQDGEVKSYLPAGQENRANLKVNSADFVSVTEQPDPQTKQYQTVIRLGNLPLQTIQANQSGLYVMAYDRMTEKVVYNNWLN